MNVITNSLRTKDNLTLFSRHWHSRKSPKAIVTIIHGLGEHSGRYQELASVLNNENIDVASFDLRGHGKSDGPRGQISNYKTLLRDIGLFIKTVKSQKTPLFLYGHSFGGNLVINYILQEKDTDISGVISSSPWLKLTTEPQNNALSNKVKTLKSIVKPHLLTRNQEAIKKYKQDPLVHYDISIRLYAAARKSGLYALNSTDNFYLPSLLMHGQADQITSWKATWKLKAKFGSSCTFKLWTDMFH